MTQNMISTTTTDAHDLDALAYLAPATDDLLQLADWLATNGAAHLSAIARIELAERLITRRRFLIGAGALGLGVVTGCGAEEANAPMATVATGTDGTRTVEHVYGQVELPVNPQRLIPGYTTEMDYALVLGIPMVAGTGARGGTEPFATYQREAYPRRLNNLEKVVTYPEANYEQIATQQPDCILDQVAADDQERYNLLSRIAPTFVFRDYQEVEELEFGKPDWRGSLRTVGQAFGATDAAEQYIATYEGRVEALRGRLAERWSSATFAIGSPNPESFFVFARFLQTTQILFDELNLEPASVVGSDGTQLSLETVPEIDADVLFLVLGPQEDSLERDREAAEIYLNSPLWQEIPAVREDQVYEMDQELIYTGPLTATAFLDYVERTLLG